MIGTSLVAGGAFTPPRRRTARRGSRGPVLWLLAAAVVAVAYLFRGLMPPLFLAATVTYLLNPLVVWAESFAVRRSVAVVGLFLVILIVVMGSAVVLGPSLRDEAKDLADSLPALAGEVDEAIEAAEKELGNTFPALRRFLPSREGRQLAIDRFIEGRAGNLAELLDHAGTVLMVLVLVPFFAFFLLRDSGRLFALIVDRLPPPHIETSVAVWCEIDRIIGRYLRGVALDGIAVGVLAAIGLWLIDVPYPLILGAFTGLANVVPFLGPILGAAVTSLVVVTDGQGLGAVGQVVLLFVVIKLVDDIVLQPLAIGRSVHLHPMLLLGSVVAGQHAFGILGMVVAVPAVTVLMETARLLLEHRRALAGITPPVYQTPSGAPQYLC